MFQSPISIQTPRVCPRRGGLRAVVGIAPDPYGACDAEHAGPGGSALLQLSKTRSGLDVHAETDDCDKPIFDPKCTSLRCFPKFTRSDLVVAQELLRNSACDHLLHSGGGLISPGCGIGSAVFGPSSIDVVRWLAKIDRILAKFARVFPKLVQWSTSSVRFQRTLAKLSPTRLGVVEFEFTW